MVQELTAALGSRLRSVVLYGSAARGDFQEGTSDFNLIVNLESLDPDSLAALAPVFARWQKRGHSLPRIFSPALIRESADVFPIEFLDLKTCRTVLHGDDPFAGLTVRPDYLRLQCERELREKLMRLREGFVVSHARPKDLRRLMTDSYTTFVALFRGCLYLFGGDVPLRNREVVNAFCTRAGLDSKVFEEVDRLKRGEKGTGDLKMVFSRYYEELTRAVGAVDRFKPPQGGENR